MNEVNGYEIVMGCLLHDIGKFFQRASSSEGVLGQETRGLESTICRVYNSRYTHRHVLFTSEFCSLHLNNLPSGVSHDRVHSLAAYHHRPADTGQSIVEEADHLSSGMDRISDGEAESSGRSSFRKIRLQPVLASVGQPPESACNWVHELTRLTANSRFPLCVGPDTPDSDRTADYQDLWKTFLSAWKKNQVTDPWGFVNRCLAILEEFTWCIPSATWGVIPDISLYDHLKTSAAIGLCLHSADDNAVPFRLVIGDFGGIQSYIFDIHAGAGGLAKRLRARSFYVDLAGSSVALEVLRRSESPLTNCLLLSGGKFILLLPNNRATRSVLEDIRRSLDSWSVHNTRGEVRLALASMGCARQDILDYANTLSNLHDLLSEEKLHPLKSYLHSSESGWSEDAFLLDPLLDAEQEEVLCKVCQRRGGSLNEEGDSICSSCAQDARIGALLPSTRAVAFFGDDPPHGAFKLPFGSAILLRNLSELQKKPFAVMALDGMEHDPPACPLISGVRARHVPIDEDGTVCEFTTIGEAATGRKALACLKADVDNLGWMFRSGLATGEKDRRSISRLSTLSGSFSHFFSSYMGHLVKEEYPWIYMVYSGGDDLLCLGPWDRIFSFAERLRSDLSRYCCENRFITLSAGIVLMGAKTPVNVVIGEADRALKVSKEINGQGVLPHDHKKSGECTKDRITAFETSLPWSTLPLGTRKAKDFMRLLQDSELSTGQVRRLLYYSELYRNFQKTGQTSFFSYAPKLVYDINRNWHKKGASKEYERLLEWVEELSTPGNDQMAALRFITQYALYGIRSRSGGDYGEEG